MKNTSPAHNFEIWVFLKSGKAKDECSRILKPKEEKGKLEDEADKLLAMREKLKKEKEEAEKKRMAEENAAAEAKGRVPPIKI